MTTAALQQGLHLADFIGTCVAAQHSRIVAGTITPIDTPAEPAANDAGPATLSSQSVAPRGDAVQRHLATRLHRSRLLGVLCARCVARPVLRRGRAFAALVADWSARMASRHELRDLSDHMLHDIGLTRAEAMREASKPFWRA